MDHDSSTQEDRQSAIDQLNEIHDFPCAFRFKVIGANTPAFVAQVLQAAVLVLGKNSTPSVTTRASSQGRHQSVTVEADVESAEQVLAVFAAFRAVPGVKLLM